MRLRSLLAAAFIGSLASPAAAFASSTFRPGAAPRAVSASPASRGATHHSSNFAGYVIAGSNSNLNARATIVVPGVKCGKRDQAVGPSVGMDDVVSKAITAADLFVACSQGKALFVPALVLNGVETNYKLKVHPGDKVALYASETATKGTVTFTDLTTKAKKTKTGPGVGTDGVEFPWIGDVAVFKGTSTKPLGVPNFGTIGFTGAKVLGKALGGYPHKALVRFDRYNSKNTILQIHTTGLSSSGLSFKTLFKHS